MPLSSLFSKNNIHIIGNQSRVMLFAHGYGCDQNMWRFITPSFQDDFKIVLFDHVGSGKSDLAYYDYQKYSSLEGYAEDIVKICEELSLKDVTLVCHSVSCMIGLLATIQAPQFFEQLIMIGPSPRYIDDVGYRGGFSQTDIDEMLENLDSNYLGWASAIAPVIMDNPQQPHLARELENSFCQNDPKIAKHFAKVTFLGDNRGDIPKSKIKTLIIQSASDIIAPIEVGEYLHTNLSNSSFSVISSVGHCPHLSHPQETILAIKSFLSNG